MFICATNRHDRTHQINTAVLMIFAAVFQQTLFNRALWRCQVGEQVKCCSFFGGGKVNNLDDPKVDRGFLAVNRDPERSTLSDFKI